jgi:hypothetical protein
MANGHAPLKSVQQVLNEMTSNTKNDHPQAAINKYLGKAPNTDHIQNIRTATGKGSTLQEVLYNKLKVSLSLTKPMSNYSEQWLLNAAQANSISIDTLLK